MSRTVSLPDDVVRKAEELAKHEGVSLDTFVAERLKDQFAGLEYLESRALRADERRFRSALAQIPDAPGDPNDHL
jgi:hypothetical protein